MRVAEFHDLVDAWNWQRKERLKEAAHKACWIINSIPHFGKGRRKAVRPSDLVDLPGEGVTRMRQLDEAQELFESFREATKGLRLKYGPPRPIRKLDGPGKVSPAITRGKARLGAKQFSLDDLDEDGDLFSLLTD